MKTIILMCHSAVMREETAPPEMWGLSLDGVMAASKLFKDEIFSRVEQVFSSTQRRAYDTAMILSGGVTLDSELDDLAWDEPYDECLPSPKLQGRAAFTGAGERMLRFIKGLADDMGEGEYALAVSHPASILAFLGVFCSIGSGEEAGISFRDGTICSGGPKMPSAFILEFENGGISHIRYLERA